jgi:hypothetical protein
VRDSAKTAVFRIFGTGLVIIIVILIIIKIGKPVLYYGGAEARGAGYGQGRSD